MKEEDKDLLDLMMGVDDFLDLLEFLDTEGIDYDELDLAKQYEMIHSPFAEIEEEY